MTCLGSKVFMKFKRRNSQDDDDRESSDKGNIQNGFGHTDIYKALIGTSKSAGNSSRAFQTFISTFGSIKSKHEEEQFIKKELELQAQKLAQPSVKPPQYRESLLRLVYCHMLGYDVSFAYMYAIKLAQQGSMMEKRAGYLACVLFLHEDHEMVIMLINTLQRDLKSTNSLHICMALDAVTQLINAEMIPSVLPLVEERLNHQKTLVRKKAVLCLHYFLQKAPHLRELVLPHLKKALSDKDIGTVWAAVQSFHDLIKEDPGSYKELSTTLTNIMQQILAGRLPTDFEYHTVPLPWMQIQILKMLARLGADDDVASQAIHTLVKFIMQKTDPSHKIGQAIIYECLETVCTLKPNPVMTEFAANCVGRFLSSKSLNLKYLGLTALTSLSQLNAGYVTEHQEVVLDCLEFDHVAIRRKTLGLLHQIGNQKNAHVICSKMLDNLVTAHDPYLKRDIINKVTDLCERYMKNPQLYVDTINRVMFEAKDLLPPTVVHNTVQCIQKGTQGEKKAPLRDHLAILYWGIVQQENVPESLVQVAAWVLGELGQTCSAINLNQVVMLFTKLCTKQQTSSTTKAWILTAFHKLILHIESPIDTLHQLNLHITKENSELFQRLLELSVIVQDSAAMKKEFKNRNDDGLVIEEMDFSLSFLDEYVAEALESGARPYKPSNVRAGHLQKSAEMTRLFSGLKFAHHESPQSLDGSSSGDRRNQSVHSDDRGEFGIKLKGVKKVWGKEGLIKSDPVPEMKTIKVPDEETVESAPAVFHLQRSQELNQPDQRLIEQKKQEERKALASALFGGIERPQLQAPVSENLSSVRGYGMPQSRSMSAGFNPQPTTLQDMSKSALNLNTTPGGFDYRTVLSQKETQVSQAGDTSLYYSANSMYSNSGVNTAAPTSSVSMYADCQSMETFTQLPGADKPLLENVVRSPSDCYVSSMYDHYDSPPPQEFAVDNTNSNHTNSKDGSFSDTDSIEESSEKCWKKPPSLESRRLNSEAYETDSLDSPKLSPMKCAPFLPVPEVLQSFSSDGEPIVLAQTQDLTVLAQRFTSLDQLVVALQFLLHTENATQYSGAQLQYKHSDGVSIKVLGESSPLSECHPLPNLAVEGSCVIPLEIQERNCSEFTSLELVDAESSQTFAHIKVSLL